MVAFRETLSELSTPWRSPAGVVLLTPRIGLYNSARPSFCRIKRHTYICTLFIRYDWVECAHVVLRACTELKSGRQREGRVGKNNWTRCPAIRNDLYPRYRRLSSASHCHTLATTMADVSSVAGPSGSALGLSTESGVRDQVMARLFSSFPDGMSHLRLRSLSRKRADDPAQSLSRHAQIHAKLQLEILDVKEEVVRLKGELRRDQDPGKMSRIQTQIGVSCFAKRRMLQPGLLTGGPVGIKPRR